MLDIYKKHNIIIEELEEVGVTINALDDLMVDLMHIVIQSYGFPEENSDNNNKEIFCYDYIWWILIDETLSYDEIDLLIKKEYEEYKNESIFIS